MMEILTSAIDFLRGVIDSSRHPFIILGMAATLDYLIGDPWGWPHPVQWMGWMIDQFRQKVWQGVQLQSWQPATQQGVLRGAGIVLGVGLIAGSAIISGGLISFWKRQPAPIAILGSIIEIILLASCFAGHSLRKAAEEVLESLADGDLVTARCRLSLYVGRDTENLSEAEILRAVLETVTENATDGVMAPLFYAILGAAIPGVGSVPLALAYKAASTLDSMIGYRHPPYAELGWFSAQLEDRLTWLPCRLLVITIALLSGKPCEVIKICQRDAWQDPSPNSGWSECAYAAALNVQMGGMNYYQGKVKQKPLLGNNIESITPRKICQALCLTRFSFLIWLGCFLILRCRNF